MRRSRRFVPSLAERRAMNGDERLSRLSAIKLALLAQQARAESSDLSLLRAEPIAIIGIGCRFPRGNSPEEFWQSLRDGVDAISEVPGDRWSWKDFYDSDPSAPGKMTSRWGGFIESVDGFDAPFFGISPREAAHLDPQQRLFLEVAYEALDDAGLVRARIMGERVGVFVGSYHNDYALAQYTALDAIDAYSGTGTSHSILANRLSYLLDLRGPSVSVDTACSSSLVATHLACESLRYGESDIAVVGAVTLMLTPAMSIGLSKWGFLAEDGRCKTFDTRANGFVRGEGAGAIVLKRLGDALAAGDVIHGLVRGSAANQDGRTSVLTAPSGLAQQAVVRAALANGAVSPDQVSYFEAHGTGTALGDPIEVEALAEVIGERAPDKRVVLGAVKTNIGHLEAAAGIAGIIKVLLAMRHQVIPGNLHFTAINRNIGSGADRFEIPTAPRPWPRNALPRIAGVSSFGFGGTNAHVVLEEAPMSNAGRTALRPPAASSTAANMAGAHDNGPPIATILAISAQSDTALEVLASRYSELLRANPGSVADVCHSAALHRDHLDCRAAIVGGDEKSMIEGLDAIARGKPPLNGGRGRHTPGARPSVAFIFSGQGPQWWAMGRELRETEAVFAKVLAECDAALAPHMNTSLLAELDRSEATSRIRETEIAQPAIFGIQVALAALWKSWGVDAGAVAGHSVGEVAAAHVAGALSLADAARLVAYRGRIMQEATGLGQMASVELTEREATEIALASNGLLSVAAINGQRSCVLSGDRKALTVALEDLTDRGISHRLLPVNYAFHSSQMAPFEAKLIRFIDRIMPSFTSIPFVSTVTGGAIEGSSLGPDYWARNMRQTVRFAAAVEALSASGIDTFVEVAPHPVLSVSIVELCESKRPAPTIVASLRRGRPESQTMRTALATIYSSGASVRWQGVFPQGGSRVTLPIYPWQRTRHWLKPQPALERRQAGHPLLGRRIVSPALKGALFETRVSSTFPDFLRDHVIFGSLVFPGTAFIEMALSAAPAGSDGEVLSVRNLFLHQPLRLTEGQERIVQCTIAPASDGFGFEIFSTAAAHADQAAWIQHATGSIARIAASAPTQLDLAAIRARCSRPVSPGELYASYAAIGIKLGPLFRGVRHVQAGNDEVLAEIAAPGAVEAQRDYLVHPALLDACFQVVLAMLPRDEGDAATLLLPRGYDSLTLLRRPVGRLWSHATMRPTTDAASPIADIVVTDESGVPFVRIDGLRMARTSTAELATGTDLAAEMYCSEWRTAAGNPAAAMSTGTWLVLTDQSGVGARLGDRLRDAGARVIVAEAAGQFACHGERWTLRAAAPEEFVRLLREARPSAGWSGIVHCWNLDADASAFASAGTAEHAALAGMASSLHLAHALLRDDSMPPVWFVSRGARMLSGQSAVAPLQALQWGFARSLEAEHPELRVVRIDLDPTSGSDLEAESEAIVRELGAARPAESEVAWRDGMRYVPRLVRMKRQRSGLTAPGNDGVRLVAGSNHLIEGLTLQPLEDATLGPDDIELDVEATGLNFRDVLNAIGMSPGTPMPLGGECAGRVRRVGANVHLFSVGDRAMAFAAGSFASRVVVDARRAIGLPRGIDAIVAAGLPIAFLTAIYALHTLGSLQPGERVLVHAGTGGVGMAAIQVALRAGAQVFATASTPKKRQLLINVGVSYAMDSRTLDFADEINRITKGEGVHVVLNSLAGEFISRSFEVLAQGGRFLEIGKRGIRSAADVERERPDVLYHALDLADVAVKDPATVARLLGELSVMLENGTLHPLPTSRWPLAEAASAFRHMAQARHIGKIVIVHESAPAAFQPLRADGSYLVTGGLGALGLATAQWMVGRGAKRVVLVGRSAPDEQAAAAIALLRKSGATVLAESLDISNDADVANLIRSIAESGMPLRGIVHAAGVLDDGVVMEQTWARSLRVLSPKVDGALALARHTRGERLDFFVCYSSATGVLGSPGQSSYSAANAYLDAFCHALRASGVPATSVQWGAWRDGGMAAKQSARDASRLQAKGVRPMAASAALSALELAIASETAEVAVMSVDWHALAARSDASPLLRELVDVAPQEGEASASVLMELKALPNSRRRAFLGEHVRLSALRVLGIDDQTLIEAGRSLRELGLDSLVAVELRNALSRSLECRLPATLAFDYPTLNALADHLERRLFPMEPKVTAAPVSSDAEAIRELSEDAAETLLLAELSTGGSET
jgi:acyl transferase domain-containing protein/NADPH:quinone reductase-like Zn-dependent oxidoreductase/acyl carrier protein